MSPTADVYDGKYNFNESFCGYTKRVLHVWKVSIKIICHVISIILQFVSNSNLFLSELVDSIWKYVYAMNGCGSEHFKAGCRMCCNNCLVQSRQKKNHEIFGESVSTSTQCSRYKFRRSEEYVMLLLIITDMRKRVTVHATLMFHCSTYLLNNLLSEFLWSVFEKISVFRGVISDVKTGVNIVSYNNIKWTWYGRFTFLPPVIWVSTHCT